MPRCYGSCWTICWAMPGNLLASIRKRASNSGFAKETVSWLISSAMTVSASIWPTVRDCLGPFSASTASRISRARASGWPPCSASFTAMAVRSGRKPLSSKARPFTSRWDRWGKLPMHEKLILLVEDNPDDEVLTLRALEKNNVLNRVVVARDGVEALEYLFGTGAHAGRDPSEHPQVILLDLTLPKVDGLGVLRQLRADPRTHLVPVVVLTSSDEQRDLVDSYQLGVNSYVRKPVDFVQFVEAVRQLHLYWLVLNETPP